MNTLFILSTVLAVLSSAAALPRPQDETPAVETVSTSTVTTPVELTTTSPSTPVDANKAADLTPDIQALIAKELQEEKNKKLVLDFYQTVFGDKDVDGADQFIDENTYIQHNPAVADGRHAFKTAMKGFLKGQPKDKIDVQHVGADGDFVYLHLKGLSSGKVASIMDIFRIQNNKIVEHWDAIQQLPEKSANDHPLF